MKNSLSLLFSLLFVSGCTMTIIEEPVTEEMLVQGANLSRAPIPKEKSLIEFTTNVSIPVALAELQDNTECSSVKSKPIGVATKAFDPGMPEDNKNLNGNVRYLKGVGNMKFSARPISLERVYFHADAGKVVTFSALAQMGSSNGYYSHSRSCGPVMVRFSPREGRKYRLEFIGQANSCTIQLQEINKIEITDLEQKYTVWSCKNGSDNLRSITKSLRTSSQ